MTEPGCLFCRIVAGELPATKVHEDDLVLGIRDINPVAPTHILLLPKSHVASVADLTSADAEVLGALFAAAAALARSEDIEERGYRVVTNVGRDAGQSVDHLHFHLLGGRPMSWPPG
ncbi:MAG TPA: histidine triad nucleotide-binding protein [Candidatus Limnocylindrales bacterium]|nr:histidine triad nucleotide-binding protein [Candidatus Limnocylindrales bacterium]